MRRQPIGKKALIIANLFHASPRIPGLVKYLPEFGWEGIVVTVPIGENPEAHFGPPDDFKDKHRVMETKGHATKTDVGEQAARRFNLASSKSYRHLRPLLRMAYRFYSEIFHYPDREKGWRDFALEAGESLLENEQVDAIISSSSPATCHIIARELKRRHGTPWVADLRDLWTQNHNYPYSGFRRMIERRLELQTLRHADALVTVSSPLAQHLKGLHNRPEVYVITNGFDPERLNEKERVLTSKFTITYTGQVYPGRQDPSRLFIALRVLIDNRTIEPGDVRVRFYGPEREVLARGIEKYGLEGIARQYGVVTRQAALEKQGESQLLLVFNWEDPWEKGLYGLKIFEYLASGRPILATGGFGDGVAETLLEETKAGVYCETVEDIKRALNVFYSEYKSSGTVSYFGDMEEINKYSYREMARRFADVLGQASSVHSDATRNRYRNRTEPRS